MPETLILTREVIGNEPVMHRDGQVDRRGRDHLSEGFGLEHTQRFHALRIHQGGEIGAHIRRPRLEPAGRRNLRGVLRSRHAPVARTAGELLGRVGGDVSAQRTDQPPRLGDLRRIGVAIARPRHSQGPQHLLLHIVFKPHPALMRDDLPEQGE